MKPSWILLPPLLLVIGVLAAACGPGNPPSLSLEMSASSSTYQMAGEVITYTYTLKNNGSATLSGLSLTDGGVPVTCPADYLFPGAPLTCTRQVTISAEDMLAGAVETTATAEAWQSSNNCCGPSQKASASASLRLTLADQPGLVLEKKADHATFGELGEAITYSYTLTNVGNVPLTGDLVISDDRTQVTCPSLPVEGLAPDESITCTATHAVTMDDLRLGKVVNTAEAVIGGIRSNPATLEIPVTPRLDLVLEKNAQPASYMYAGEIITFTLTITNFGNVPLDGPLTITDPMLTDWTCAVDPLVELLPGEALTCTSTLTISSATAGASFKNTATISLFHIGEPVSSNEASVTIIAVQPPTVDCSQYTTVESCYNNGCQPSSSEPFVCYPRP